MALTQDEINYYEKQRLENDRRRDVESERDFWTNVMLSSLDQSGATVAKAVASADEALRLYKERFQ
jgi:hypothetical protein